MKPIIGITCGLSDGAVAVPSSYVKSIVRAGGTPLLIPVVEDGLLADEFVTGIDGLLLSGGPDVDPQHFGEDPSPRLGAVSPERDATELAVARAALKRDLPILAICRGIQLLNIAAGGTVVQDIASQIDDPIKHRQEAPRWHASHRVNVEHGSRLYGLVEAEKFEGEVWVNTFHHQAVKGPAPGFDITARAPDGVIEGIESRKHSFVVGVQWHPEGMWDHHPHFLGLFRGLVDAAAARVQTNG